MDTKKFDYFMERTEKDLDHIRKRVDELWDWRIMHRGIQIAIGTMLSVVVTLLTLYFKSH